MSNHEQQTWEQANYALFQQIAQNLEQLNKATQTIKNIVSFFAALWIVGAVLWFLAFAAASGSGY